MPDQADGRLSPFLRAQRIQAVLPFVRGKVLDVGCGTGTLSDYVPANRYWGVDRDAESIAIAQERHAQHRFSQDLPDQQTFDTVAALAVIEHLSDPADFLRKLRDRCEPGGQIVLTTPHPSFHKVYDIGVHWGLFSHHAHEEHEKLLGRQDMAGLAKAAGLRISHYKRFLLGANQLIVMS